MEGTLSVKCSRLLKILPQDCLFEIYSFLGLGNVLKYLTHLTCVEWNKLFSWNRLWFLFFEDLSKKSYQLKKVFGCFPQIKSYDKEFKYCELCKEFYLSSFSCKNFELDLHLKNYEIDLKFNNDFQKKLLSPFEVLNEMSIRRDLSSSRTTAYRKINDFKQLQLSFFWMYVLTCQKTRVKKFSSKTTITIDDEKQIHIVINLFDCGSRGKIEIDKVGDFANFLFTSEKLCQFIITSNISRERFYLIFKHIFGEKCLLPYNRFITEQNNHRKDIEKYLYFVLNENKVPVGYFLDFEYCLKQLYKDESTKVDLIVRLYYFQNLLQEFNEKYENHVKLKYKSWDRKIKELDNRKWGLFRSSPTYNDDVKEIEGLISEQLEIKKEFERKYQFLRKNLLQNIESVDSDKNKIIRRNRNKYIQEYKEFLEIGEGEKFSWFKEKKVFQLIGVKWNKNNQRLLCGNGVKTSMDEHVVFKGGFTKNELHVKGENLFIISNCFASRPNLSSNSVTCGAVFAKDNQENFDTFLSEYSTHVSIISEECSNVFNVSLSSRVYNSYSNLGNFLINEKLVKETTLKGLKNGVISVGFSNVILITGDFHGLVCQSLKFPLPNFQGTYNFWNNNLNLFRKQGESFEVFYDGVTEKIRWNKDVFTTKEIFDYGPYLAPNLLKSSKYLLFLPNISIINRFVDVYQHGKDRKVNEHCNQVALLLNDDSIKYFRLQKVFRSQLKQYGIIKTDEKVISNKIFGSNISMKNKKVEIYIEKYSCIQKEINNKLEIAIEKVKNRIKILQEKTEKQKLIIKSSPLKRVVDSEKMKLDENELLIGDYQYQIETLNLAFKLINPIWYKMLKIFEILMKRGEQNERFIHDLEIIKEDLISFEEMKILVDLLMDYHEDLIPIIDTTDSESFYHNYFVSALVLYLTRLPSCYLTNQMKEELINQKMNRIYNNQSQKCGSKLSKNPREFPQISEINGKTCEKVKTNGLLNTMISVRVRNDMQKKYDLTQTLNCVRGGDNEKSKDDMDIDS